MATPVSASPFSSALPLLPLLPRRLLPLLLPLLLYLTILPPQRQGAVTAQSADCSDASSFRSGQEDFVVDAEDATEEGAELLATAHAQSRDDCVRACCATPRCDLALLQSPNGDIFAASAENRTCVLFRCVHRNRFVCRFVNQRGYSSYVRESVYRKYLAGPQESRKPIADAGRDVIIQPGQTVTLNGIESLALGDAHITSYQWRAQRTEHEVQLEGTRFPDQVRLSDLRPGSYDFLLTVTDSNGQSEDAEVSVLVLGPEESSSYCLAPVKVGPCRAAFPRWRYDVTTGSCVQFVFGGCKANKNNFLSSDQCESACGGVTATSERSSALPTEVCDVTCRPEDQLTCGSGCCLDRSLECDGVKQCSDAADEEHCHQLNQTFSRLLSIDVNQRKARCAEPPVTGPCRASHTRWYYDPLDRKCHRFTYGGCHGNDNNFEAEQKCSEMCDGVTERNVNFRGMFDRYEKEDDDKDDSGSVALAVVLAVAILALLAVLTYCFLKKRRSQTRSPAPISTTHAALSEQETLVYNSTTKPV